MHPERMFMTLSPSTGTQYPRGLRSKEVDLLEFVLPSDRPGYREYHGHIARMVVLAEGRRGKGNFVLGMEGDVADTVSPLPPVIAYGMVETTQEKFSITVREYVGRQIDVEIVSDKEREVPDHFEEKRRWTYSTWLPGQASPATGEPVREVRIDDARVLAIARGDGRLWVHDGATGMNHPIPITGYYSELMLQKGIRDPQIALKYGRFFESLNVYSDTDLRASFIAYNKSKPRVEVQVPVPVPQHGRLEVFLKKFFGRKS